MFKVWQRRWRIACALMVIVLLVNTVLSIQRGILWSALTQVLALGIFSGICFLLRHKLHQDVERNRTLLRISQGLSSRLELSDFLDYIVRSIGHLVPHANKCVIHLLDEQAQRLHPRYSSQPDSERAFGMRADQGVAGQALTERRTKIIPDVRQDPYFLPLQSGPELRSLMVAPLYVQSKPLGTLSLNSSARGAFSEDDERLVTTLAAQASTAIYQAQLYAESLHERHFIEAIINNLNDGLVVLDDQDRIVRYNPPLAHLIGADVSDLIGQKVDENSEKAGLRQLAFILGDQDIKPEHQREIRIDEPIHAVLQVTVSLIRGQNGNWERIVIVHDQTEMIDQIQAESNLITAAARELTPSLESIRGYVMLLKSGGYSQHPKAVQWINRIQETNARLLRLSNGLGDLSDINTGSLHLTAEAVDFVDLLTDVIKEVSPAAERKEASIDLLCPQNLPNFVLDPDRIRHVLLNLFENAIHRAVRGGHITAQVEVSLKELTLTLSDDGVPIPRDIRERIFQGTYCPNGTRPQDPAGTGFSLYLSRRIIEAHGGYLWMPENGSDRTSFRLFLPLDSIPNESA